MQCNANIRQVPSSPNQIHRIHRTIQISQYFHSILFFVNKRWIVTAAHCIKFSVEKKVCLGITETGKCKQKLLVAPSNQHIYPLYNETPHLHDIGLYDQSFWYYVFYGINRKSHFIIRVDRITYTNSIQSTYSTYSVDE